MCIKQKLISYKKIINNLVDFYASLSRFFCYPDPDPGSTSRKVDPDQGIKKNRDKLA